MIAVIFEVLPRAGSRGAYLAQSAGRRSLFADYRLRVASIVRDHGMNDRAEAPADSRAIHDR